MTRHVVRQIDPTPGQRGTALRRLAARSGVAPPALGELERQAATPSGVCRSFGTAFTAAWWTDPIGRKHWAFEARPREWPYDPPGRPPPAEPHPLGWIAPPLSAGWRTRGARREFLVICRCGVAGSPESIAWMGSTCGPCHDREQEGSPPAGLPPWREAVGDVGPFFVTPGGLLVASRPGGLAAWDAPWAGPPRWTRPGEANLRSAALSPDGRTLALWTWLAKPFVFLDTDDGSARPPLTLPGRLVAAWAALDDGRLLASVGELPLHSFSLCAWSRRPDGGYGDPAPLAVPPYDALSAVAVSPDGRRVAVSRGGRVVVHDAATGEERDSFRLLPSHQVMSLRFTAGGVVAVTRLGDAVAGWLCRWEERAEGWWGRLVGPAPPRTARLSNRDLPLTLAPDGRLAFPSRGLVLLDPRTLEEVLRFEPSQASVSGVAFSGDGQVLARTDRGLAVWPWGEVFG